MLTFLKRIDEKITWFLTGIVWWVDVHFNKDNVWCARTTFVICSVLLPFASENPPTRDKISLVLGMSLTVLIFIAIFDFMWHFLFERSPTGVMIMNHAKQSPNPNKHLPVISLVKVLVAILMVIVFLKTQNIPHTTAFLCFLATFFFLCTDNIPPTEKQQRKERNGTRKAFPLNT